MNTAKNLIQLGNINKTLSKSVEDSKKEIADALIQSKNQRKRIKTSQKYCKPNKIRKYHLVKWIQDLNPRKKYFIIGKF